MTNRDKIIRRMYRTEEYSLQQIGKKFKITAERVRQIVDPPKILYCRRHKYKYPITATCIFCPIDLVYAQTSMSMTQIVERIKQLKLHTRVEPGPYERKLISKMLRKRFKLTPGFIGKLLNRDTTTIQHFLNN